MVPTSWIPCTANDIKAPIRNAAVGGPFGSNLVSRDYQPFGVPVIRGNNLSFSTGYFNSDEFVFVSEEKAKELSANIAIPGDIVFTQRGTLGQVGIVPDNLPYKRFVISQSQMKLTCDRSKADPLFVYYCFKTPQTLDYIQRNVISTGVPHINLAILKQSPLLLPPLDEQKAIAHILGTLDDKIELNQQMNQTLEGIARALFKSWFIDFDPVRAKLDGRQPVGMDTETAALFPDEFENSAIGQIPKGWRVVPLPEAIEINPTRSLPKAKLAPYLDMQNMPTKGHRPSSWTYREFGSGTKFIQGDTLLARITPCLENGKTAFVDFLPEREVGWGSTEYIVFRPKAPLSVEFGYFLARSDELRTHAIQNMTGSSGRQRVPANCFLSYFLTVPSDPVAQKFGDAVVPSMRLIRAYSEQNATLTLIRDALLPKLLSGEIRVKDAEKVVETVT